MAYVSIGNGAVNGNLLDTITPVTTTYTVSVNDGLVQANATSAAFTVTLPTAASAAGQSVTVQKTDASANAVTVAAAGSDTINGASTAVLTAQYAALKLTSNGTTWTTAASSGATASPVVTLTPAATIALNPGLGSTFTVVPAQGETINASSVIAGQRLALVVTTSGTTSYTLTFGTNFKTTGTLATGTVSGKVFVIYFVCDGTNYNEVARTTAM